MTMNDLTWDVDDWVQGWGSDSPVRWPVLFAWFPPATDTFTQQRSPVTPDAGISSFLNSISGCDDTDFWAYASPEALGQGRFLTAAELLTPPLESEIYGDAEQHDPSAASPTSAFSSSSSSTSRGERTTKLRTSRRAKPPARNKQPLSKGDTDAKQRVRAGHNQVEKQYRERLNAQFEQLVDALAAAGAPGGADEDDDDDKSRSLSKAAVLELARRTLRKLDRENRSLSSQVEHLNSVLRSVGYEQKGSHL